MISKILTKDNVTDSSVENIANVSVSKVNVIAKEDNTKDSEDDAFLVSWNVDVRTSSRENIKYFIS